MTPSHPREVQSGLMTRIARVDPSGAITRGLRTLERLRHQRRHIPPKVEAAEVPRRAPNPRNGPAHVLDHHRDMMTGRLARLALDAETDVEQPVEALQCGPGLIGPDRRRLGLRPAPGHRHVAVFLTRRRRDNQRGVLELPPVNGEHILNHEVARIAIGAVDMLFDVESSDLIALGEQTFRPAAETAIEIDRQRPHSAGRCPERKPSTATATGPVISLSPRSIFSMLERREDRSPRSLSALARSSVLQPRR